MITSSTSTCGVATIPLQDSIFRASLSVDCGRMRGPHALVAAAAVLSIFVGVAWAKDDRARIGDLADDNKFQVRWQGWPVACSLPRTTLLRFLRGSR